jgi:hypothetical protein
MRKDGIQGFFTGFMPIMFRDGIYSTSTFLGIEITKNYLIVFKVNIWKTGK